MESVKIRNIKLEEIKLLAYLLKVRIYKANFIDQSSLQHEKSPFCQVAIMHIWFIMASTRNIQKYVSSHALMTLVL